MLLLDTLYCLLHVFLCLFNSCVTEKKKVNVKYNTYKKCRHDFYSIPLISVINNQVLTAIIIAETDDINKYKHGWLKMFIEGVKVN